MRLQTRLAILFGGVVTAVAVLMGTLSYVAMASRLEAQIDQSLLEVSTPLARELATGDLPRQVVDDHDGRDGRGGRGSELVLPTQVLLPDGRVISDPQDVALPTDEQDRLIASSATPVARLVDATIESRPYRVVTQTAGGSQGAVQVGRDVSENVRVLTSLAWLLAAIGLLVALLAACGRLAVGPSHVVATRRAHRRCRGRDRDGSPGHRCARRRIRRGRAAGDLLQRDAAAPGPGP